MRERDPEVSDNMEDTTTQLYHAIKEDQYYRTGGDIWEIEDEEEFLDAWIKWLRVRIPEKRIKNRKRVVSAFDKLDRKFRRRIPEYAAIMDEIESQEFFADMP